MVALLLLSILAQAPSPAAQTTVQPAVHLEAVEYLTGPVALVATIEPVDTPFVRVDFVVDGIARCRVTAAPLRCHYDFGPTLRLHRVQIVVTTATGARLSDAFESKAVTLDEAVSVQSVFLPVVVTDRQGRFINGLTQRSFKVLEDDVPQAIQFFAAENAPLEVVLAIDISESMVPLIGSVRPAAQAFLAGLAPADRVTLLAFNERVFVVSGADVTDRAQKAALIGQLRPGGGTALFDAIAKGAEKLGGEMRRRAIIVFTDGNDEHSVSTLAQIEQVLAVKDAVLYVIAYGRDTGKQQQQRLKLFEVADRTAGHGFTLTDIKQVQHAFDDILESLSHHYLLGYTPARTELDGKFRRIAVQLTDRNADDYRVRARAGYRAVARTDP